MAKRTAKFVARGLKSGLRNLLVVLAHPTKHSRNDNSKARKVLEEDRITTVIPLEAFIVQDDPRQSSMDEQLDPLCKESQSVQDVEKSDSTGSLQLKDDDDSVTDSGECIHDVSEQEKTKLTDDHQPHPENSSGADPDTSIESPKSARTDSGTMIPTSVAVGAAREVRGGDELPDTVEPTRSPKDCTIIPHKSDLARQLQTAALEHRNLKILEQDADAQLKFLEDQGSTITLQIDSLQATTEEIKSGGVDVEASAEIDAQYDAIADLREAEEDNWQRQQRLKRHMSELYQQFRDGQCALFDSLDIVLVKDGLLPNDGRSTAADIPPPDSSVKADDIEPGHSSTKADDPHTGSHSPTIKDKLLRDFIIKRRNLGTCELRFDTKEDLFDALEEDRVKQLAAGEEMETLTEFDMFLYEETRQMTRALIDAEAQYEVAKAAAVAAGIQLKYSDIESGFADDVNDGYRISMERDMVESCDRVRIENWLMDMEEKECPMRFPSVRDFAGVDIMSEADEFVLHEVEISDSRSMVAEGPSRRRIDRWEAQIFGAE